MKILKMTLVIASLVFSHSALSNTHATANPAVTTVSDLAAIFDHPGVNQSKAKDNCKKLGGKWKPIRKICVIDSLTIEGL